MTGPSYATQWRQAFDQFDLITISSCPTPLPMDDLAAGEQAAVGTPYDELVPEVMALIVETCADHLDTKSLCSLLQASNACRTAIQGSRGHHSISVKATTSAVSGLKAWLPKWAGLVAGLCLLDPAGWYSERHKPVSKEILHGLMSAIKLHTVPLAATSAAAGNSSTAAPTASMPLLLTSFSSKVAIPPSTLEVLPAATVTHLELKCCFGWNECAQLEPVIWRLSNLKHLAFTHQWHVGDDELPGSFLQSLSSLTRLTGLQIGPLLTCDANSCLPTCLVALKLEFQTVALPQLKAKTAHSPSGDAASEAASSAGASSADSEDDGWWLGAEEGAPPPRWWEEEEWEVTEEQQQAAQLLDLTYLPLLQCCQVMRTHPTVYDEIGLGYNYTDLVTLRLAAPHLTSLLLINHFKDVEGLQDCTKLQQLRLQGCAIPAPRLAQVITGFPRLADFWYCGTELVEGAPWLQSESPIAWASIAQQQQLAAALSTATQLTSLFIDGLSENGHVKIGEKGEVTLNQNNWQRNHEFQGWAEQVAGLTRLQRLAMTVPIQDADIPKLKQLTALTYLNFWDCSQHTSDSAWDEILPHMPRLQRLNGHFDVDIGWW